MHPIIQSFLATFSKEQSVESLDECDRFERFANYCILTNRCPVRFELDDVTTGEGEVGIDGIAILIGDDLITTIDDAEDVFNKRRQDLDVRYIFIQSKRTESFDRNSILNLGSAIRDVLQENPSLSAESRLSEASKIHKVVIKNISKVRNGQPSCYLYYVALGKLTGDPVLQATCSQVVSDLLDTKYFYDARCDLIDFDLLKREWMETRAPIEAKFTILNEISIPPMEGVSEALLLVVSASEFVDNVLTDSRGELRSNIFEQNVRHFLGQENEVNAQIGATLSDVVKRHRFAILNNGITIVASEIRRISTTVTIKNFQIVNGCQTSHVLFHSRGLIDASVTLVVKAISASESKVVDELVVATNSQTKVTESQFYAMRSEVREIQSLFSSFPGEGGDERRLFFERRLGEFAGKEIAGIRIFDIHLLAKTFASMFLDAPHDALGSPRRVYELQDLYSKSGIEIAYYTAAFTFYRLQLMLSNNQIDRHRGYMKWHVLTAIRYQVIGSIPLTAAASAIEKECGRLLEIIWAPPKECLPVFEQAVDLVRKLQTAGPGELKAKAFTDRLVSVAKKKSSEAPPKSQQR